MSEISISNNSINAIAMDAAATSAESARESTHTVISGANTNDTNSMELAIVGSDTVSRTQDYIGIGPDLSSTGTDGQIQHAVSSAIMSGTGSIADKIV